MNSSAFRNEILTKGAILGGAMLLFSIIEDSMIHYGCSIKWMLISFMVMLLSAILYVILLNLFTRSYAQKVLDLRKEMPYFTYGNGLSYAVLISMLAGVIVAIGDYIFVHGIIGYDNYVKSLITPIQNFFWDMGEEVPKNAQERIKVLKETPTPTIISTLVGSVWSYMFSGALVGAIIAIFTRRKPQIVAYTEPETYEKQQEEQVQSEEAVEPTEQENQEKEEEKDEQ